MEQVGVLNGVQYYLGNHKFIHNRQCNAEIERHIQDIEAMGQSGVDIALETADVIIMDNNLMRITQFIELSKQVKSVLKQNIAFSISVKLSFFVLAIVGMTNL